MRNFMLRFLYVGNDILQGSLRVPSLKDFIFFLATNLFERQENPTPRTSVSSTVWTTLYPRYVSDGLLYNPP